MSPITTEVSRFKSILESIPERLTRVFLNPPALFEIRNIRTGEIHPQFPPVSDGTLADRTARTLGRNWRVFPLTATPSEAHVPATAPHDQTNTTRNLDAICNALQRRTTAIPTPAPPLPPNIHLEPGLLTVTFANTAELQDSLQSLTRSLAEQNPCSGVPAS